MVIYYVELHTDNVILSLRSILILCMGQLPSIGAHLVSREISFVCSVYACMCIYPSEVGHVWLLICNDEPEITKQPSAKLSGFCRHLPSYYEIFKEFKNGKLNDMKFACFVHIAM